MATHGLFLTKAAPLHYGHISCIDRAIQKCSRVTVVVYETDVINVPLRVRAGWIRSKYRNEIEAGTLRVIEAWDGPTEVGYTDEIKRGHEEFVYGTLGITGVTHVFSSEPYGEHMAEAVGAKNVQIDPERIRFPISGTMIRETPWTYRTSMPSPVYRDAFVTKVLVIGAPSTGKTTLCEALADVYDTTWAHEVGRDYWQEHQVDRKLTNEQLYDLALQHRANEVRQGSHARKYLFCDTSPLTTLLFAEEYHGQGDERLVKMAERTARDYDVILLLDKSIPFDDTWERDGANERDVMQRRYYDILSAWKIPYYEIVGADMDDRIAQVVEILNGFEKWS